MARRGRFSRTATPSSCAARASERDLRESASGISSGVSCRRSTTKTIADPKFATPDGILFFRRGLHASVALKPSSAPPLTLAHWRRTVAEMYADVRAATDASDAAARFRAARDRLFAEHPDSPLTSAQRARW